MFLDKLFGKGRKKESDNFDSLFDDVNESGNSEYHVRKESKSNSFYNNDSDDLGIISDNQEGNLFKEKKKGFYGFKNADDDLIENGNLNDKIFNFAWWEYVIILIEFLLLIYVILLFAGIVSI